MGMITGQVPNMCPKWYQQHMAGLNQGHGKASQGNYQVQTRKARPIHLGTCFVGNGCQRAELTPGN